MTDPLFASLHYKYPLMKILLMIAMRSIKIQPLRKLLPSPVVFTNRSGKVGVFIEGKLKWSQGMFEIQIVTD